MSHAWGSRAHNQRQESADARNYLLRGIRQLLPLPPHFVLLSFPFLRVSLLLPRVPAPSPPGGPRDRGRRAPRPWRGARGSRPAAAGTARERLRLNSPRERRGGGRDKKRRGGAEHRHPASFQPELALPDYTFDCE